MPLKTSCVLCPNRRRQRQPQAGSDLIERSVSVNMVRLQLLRTDKKS